MEDDPVKPPRRPDLAWELCDTLFVLGQVALENRPEVAIPYFELGLQYHDATPSRCHPGWDKARADYLTWYGDEIRKGNPAGALECYEAALSIRATLMEATPQDVELLSSVAVSLGDLGGCHQKAGTSGPVSRLSRT